MNNPHLPSLPQGLRLSGWWTITWAKKLSEREYPITSRLCELLQLLLVFLSGSFCFSSEGKIRCCYREDFFYTCVLHSWVFFLFFKVFIYFILFLILSFFFFLIFFCLFIIIFYVSVIVVFFFSFGFRQHLSVFSRICLFYLPSFGMSVYPSAFHLPLLIILWFFLFSASLFPILINKKMA